MKQSTAVLIALLSLLAGFSQLHSAPLEETFANPTDESKPWCYWYWLKSNISKDGVTKDLEMMNKVGIKLAMIGNIEGGGPVKMFSPEWYEITRHALREANRLAIELLGNCFLREAPETAVGRTGGRGNGGYALVC